MKKSRIIVPAMAMIAFSTAASIAGSVAWFTASRSATINAGTYAVVKTNADLAVTLSDGVGTTVTNGTTESPNLRSVSLGNNVLTDGSFNHLDGNIFAPKADGDELDTTKTVNVSALNTEEGVAKLVRQTISETKKVYTAVTWGITFECSFPAGEGDYGLFLDTTSSSFAVTPAATAVTATGFRVGFYPGTAPEGSTANKRVYADLQSAANCKYIAADSDVHLAGSTYTSSELIASDTKAGALPTESTPRATATGRNDCLGIFKYSSLATVRLSYTVVAWFEGTDPNVVNQNDPNLYQSVIATLQFEAIKLAAA